MRFFRKTLIWLLLCMLVWAGGLLWFIAQIPQTPLADDVKADAIVALTGGSGRLDYALRLLADGKAHKLFISGVSKTLTVADMLRQADPELRERLRPLAKDIVLGHQAENTIGNALETTDWLKASDYKSILLVTASYHMPRGMVEFQELGHMTIIPAPVFPEDFRLIGWWSDTTSRILLLSEYHKFLAARLRHWYLIALRHG